MKKSDLEQLLRKHLEGTLTREERLLLDSWYLHHARSMSPLTDSLIYKERMNEMDSAFPFTPKVQSPKMRIWPAILIAASLFLLAGIAVYFYQDHSKGFSTYANDIDPGKKGATLTLTNGREIILADALKGELAREAGIVITKTTDGQLIYEVKEKNKDQQNKLNTLTTARGETYQVRLPDSTKIWLNAASSLQFPVTFKGATHRRVELHGEAYFEVSKDKKHPFIVNTNGQEVKVLGTRFNINSYNDENFTRTTLLEGSVSINNSLLLKPGQQANLYKSGELKVNDVDTEDAIAWKNGLFIFEVEPLENIMRRVSRWYDVDIQYEDPALKELTFGGQLSRFKKISQLLHLLEKTREIYFKIEGRTITVSKR